MSKYTVVLPDGTTASRKSARVYTHAVATRRSYEHSLAIAKSGGGWTKSNYEHDAAIVDGTSRFLKRESWRSDEQHAAYVSDLIARATEALRGATSYEEWKAIRIAETVALVEDAKADGYYDRWTVEGYCGRLDLAQKLLAKEQGRSAIAEARIVEVTGA